MSDADYRLARTDRGVIRTYRDGTPVPYPPHRCRKADTKPNKANPAISDDAHKCCQISDHEGVCYCLCGKELQYA